MKKLLVLLSTMAVASLTSAQIAQWTFETATSTNNIIGAGLTPSSTQSGVGADIGAGMASAFHTTAATAWSIPAGNGSAHSWSANNWTVGDYFQFSLSTLTYSGISVSFDQNGSGTGPRDFNLEYSLTGTAGSFTTAASYSIPSGITWSSGTYNPLSTFSFDLSGITALDNAATVFFRVTDASTTSVGGGTVGTGGTGRIDNFTVSVIPEPTTVALSILGGLTTLLAIRRKR